MKNNKDMKLNINKDQPSFLGLNKKVVPLNHCYSNNADFNNKKIKQKEYQCSDIRLDNKITKDLEKDCQDRMSMGSYNPDIKSEGHGQSGNEIKKASGQTKDLKEKYFFNKIDTTNYLHYLCSKYLHLINLNI